MGSLPWIWGLSFGFGVSPLDLGSLFGSGDPMDHQDGSSVLPASIPVDFSRTGMGVIPVSLNPSPSSLPRDRSQGNGAGNLGKGDAPADPPQTPGTHPGLRGSLLEKIHGGAADEEIPAEVFRRELHGVRGGADALPQGGFFPGNPQHQPGGQAALRVQRQQWAGGGGLADPAGSVR